jgi:hypothetical protein
MAGYLRLVADAAERDAHELAAERLRDRSRERRLADARRADEAEDRPLHAGIELADREVFENAILGLLEPRVLVVHDRLGLLEIDDLVGLLRPRQRDDPIEIGARDRVFRGGWRHFREPIELAQRLFLDCLRQAGRFELGAQLFDLARLIVAFAELLLDRLELLAQEVITLVLADLRLHLALDLRTELEHFELLDQQAVEEVEARADVERLQHFLLRFGRDRAEARRDEVGETAGVGDVRRQRLQIIGHQRRQRDDLLEVRLDVALQRIDLEPVGFLEPFGRLGNTAAQVGTRCSDFVELHARQALDDDAQAAVGQLEHLVDLARRADRMQIRLRRLVFAGFALREHRDGLAARHRFVDQLDRAFTRHRQRHERLREQHGVAQRQHRHFWWHAEGGRLRSARIERFFWIAHDVRPSGARSFTL